MLARASVFHPSAKKMTIFSDAIPECNAILYTPTGLRTTPPPSPRPTTLANYLLLAKYKNDPSKSSLHDVSTLFLRHYPRSAFVVFFHSLNPWLWLSLVLSLREASEYKKRKRYLHVYKNQKKRMLLTTKDPQTNTWNMRVHAKCVCRLVVRIIKQTRRAKHPIVFVFRYVLVADTQGEQEVDTIPAMWIIFSPLYLSWLSWSRGGGGAAT